MRVLVIVMSVLMSTPAAAEATSQEFLVQHKGQPPLFCLTTQARSELEDPVRVLKNAIGTDPSLKSSPVSIAFLVNLTRRFPCRADKDAETTK
jgi:hypothetical protein